MPRYWSVIKAIDSHSNLLKQVSELGECNSKVQDCVSELFGQMNVDLRDAILSLGLVSALGIEYEDRLADLIEGFSALIKRELKELADNNMNMQGLIRDL